MLIDIFQQQPILENDRVLLRPLEESDVEHLLPFSLNEPDTWNYGLVTAAGEENLKQYLADAVKNRNDKKDYPFIIYDKKVKAYAGSTRFYDINSAYKTSQLGFTWYGKAFRRTGLNRHCKLLILSFAFEEWGLERLEFRADARNAKSIAAMKAIGCIEEGIIRSHMPTLQGDRRNSIILSILKDEWHASVKEKLQSKVQ